LKTTITQTEGKINDILNRLDGVRKTGRGYMARCPAHEDKYPSLSITQGEDGKILLYCFAGCPVGEICTAMGIDLGQLFSDSRKRETFRGRRSSEQDFAELRRRAFIAMVEFRDLTKSLYEHYKLDTPAEILKAVQMLPLLEWYLEILTTKTNDEQIELLREGVITQWARLFNLQN
jgi:hypothetical protein